MLVLVAVVRKHFVTTISPLPSVILLLHVKLEVENLASPAFNIKLYECDFVKTVTKKASEVTFTVDKIVSLIHVRFGLPVKNSLYSSRFVRTFQLFSVHMTVCITLLLFRLKFN